MEYKTWMNLISVNLNIEEYISSKSIYLKFRAKKNTSCVQIKIKIVITLWGDRDQEGHEEGF